MKRRRGRLVVVVGPDGVGKTTFAAELVSQLGPSARYFHFRPPFRGPLAGSVGDPPPFPKKDRDVFPPGGWLRILVALVRFWAGYLTSVAPELRVGSVVVADRWAYGYLVQPRALRFAGPVWLARLVLRLMPQPHVIFNLAAPAEVVAGRKAELPVATITAELEAWRALPGPVVTLDALDPPDRLVADAMAAITE